MMTTVIRMLLIGIGVALVASVIALLMLPNSTAPGVNTIPDRNNGVEVVMFYLPGHSASPLLLNYREILGRCGFAQFAAGVNIFEVQTDVVGRCLQNLRELPLGKPECVSFQPYRDSRTIVRVIDDEFSHCAAFPVQNFRKDSIAFCKACHKFRSIRNLLHASCLRIDPYPGPGDNRGA